MPATKHATISRTTAVITAGLLLGVAPTSAQAFSWRDWLRPVAPVTEPVVNTTSQVAAPVTDTVEQIADAVLPATGQQGGCPTLPTRTAFAPFGDSADYALAPGGDFEQAAGWKLSGGARIVGGNENLGVSPGSRSLKLPIGATAVSPEFCVDETNPHFRFASRPDTSMAGYEAIVLYRSSDGSLQQTQFTSSGAQSWAPGTWSPSSASPLATRIPLLTGGQTTTVQLKFVSTGNQVAVGIGLWGRLAAGTIGTVSIDSVMVDPYRRG